MGWVNAAQADLTEDGNGWNGFTLVQRIEADGRLRSGGVYARVTFQASSGEGATITNAYIGHGDENGDDFDFESASQLFFSESQSPSDASMVIAAGAETVSDLVDFELDAAKPLLIAIYCAGGGSSDSFARSDAAPDGWQYYYKAANEAGTLNKSGYSTPGPNTASHVTKVEIYFERVTWPTNILPDCPLEAFVINPDPAVIRTATESGLARQRRMFGRTISRIQTAWSMTGTELEFFKSWYEHKAGAGSVWFLITLLVDQEQRTYDARFVEPPTYTFVRQDDESEGTLWRVEFVLEAITPPPLSAEALDLVLGLGLAALFAIQDLLVPPVTLQPAFDNWLSYFAS